jgi:hypothetical protein
VTRGLAERSKAKTALSGDNVYGSGLNRTDWDALWNLVAPHLSSRDGKLVPPGEIDPPPPPEHLVDHTVAKLVEKYRATGQSRYLDRANRTLFPSSEDNVYGSGLNRADWYALRNLVDPYLDSRDGKLVPPDEIEAAARAPRRPPGGKVRSEMSRDRKNQISRSCRRNPRSLSGPPAA